MSNLDQGPFSLGSLPVTSQHTIMWVYHYECQAILILAGRLCLYGPRTVARRHQDVHLGPHLLHQNEAISHAELPVRLGEEIRFVLTMNSADALKITKQCERMYALLAICTTLSPGPSDESIMSIVKEHYGDQLAVLQAGG